MKYKKLSIDDPRDLLFGQSLHPVKTSRGLIIGGGKVYPELNFTMPTMKVGKENINELKEIYKNIAREALDRAKHLYLDGLVLEFESLLEMTVYPEIGIEIVKVMNEVCDEYYQKYNFSSEIRLTPNDSRDFDRPPKRRTSQHLQEMLELFEKGALAGGNLLSIESIGGKEIHDEALIRCNIKKAIFALSVLGVRDMKFLWKHIVDISKRTNKIAAGDTACGFANTAMVLADKGQIPKTFAAVDRVASVVRSLVAYEEGAQGPGKDCAYENPFIKAITGYPMSMEGKTAACAHLSPVGNVSIATCDLWSNESVQNIKLLGGMAPTVYLEQLVYDTRLLNKALEMGKSSALELQKMFVESDIHYDPQAFVLAPENVIKISSEIIKGRNYVEATKNGCIEALNLIEDAHKNKKLKLEEREIPWIEKIRSEILTIPDTEEEFVEDVLPSLNPKKFLKEEYGLYADDDHSQERTQYEARA